jgi:hypothetical protein
MEFSYFFIFYIVKISIFVAVLLYFTQFISAQKAVLDTVSGPNRNLKHNAVWNPTAPAHIKSDSTSDDDDDNNDNDRNKTNYRGPSPE